MRFPSSLVLVAAAMLLPAVLPGRETITGQAAFADWNQQQPGVRRKITLGDLPEPKPEEAVNNPRTSPPALPTPDPSRPSASKSPSTPVATPPRCSVPTTNRSWPSVATHLPYRASSAPPQ
jgi:hypothetical protein